jgi:hypothetical protein
VGLFLFSLPRPSGRGIGIGASHFTPGLKAGAIHPTSLAGRVRFRGALFIFHHHHFFCIQHAVAVVVTVIVYFILIIAELAGKEFKAKSFDQQGVPVNQQRLIHTTQEPDQYTAILSQNGIGIPDQFFGIAVDHVIVVITAGIVAKFFILAAPDLPVACYTVTNSHNQIVIGLCIIKIAESSRL